jgi:hypothetical protein
VVLLWLRRALKIEHLLRSCLICCRCWRAVASCCLGLWSFSWRLLLLILLILLFLLLLWLLLLLLLCCSLLSCCWGRLLLHSNEAASS